MTTGDDDFTTSQLQVLNITLAIAGALSLCGSLFACACYVAFRHKRTFGLQLVFLLSLNDAASQIWVALHTLRVAIHDKDMDHALCIAESYFSSYFEPVCIMWSSAIAYTLYAAIIRGHQLHQVAQRLPYMALVCQGVPLASCVVSQLFDAYGESIAWCWIKSTSRTTFVLQFTTLYIPCWLCIAFNLYVYISVRLRLRALSSKSLHWAHAAPDPPQAPPSLSSLGHSTSQWISQTDFEADSNVFGSITGGDEEGSYVELVDSSQLSPENAPKSAGPFSGRPMTPHSSSMASQRDKFRKLSRRLMVYPMILVLCWSWPTLHRLAVAFFLERKVYWLAICHVIFLNFQGLLNSIAYGLTEGIGREISARWKRR